MGIKDFKAAQKKASPLANTGAMPETTIIAPADWDKLCAKIEEAYPDLQPDFAAVVAAGKGKNGMAVKLAVYKAAGNKAAGLKSRNVTVYSSGKVIWTNLAPITL